MGMFYPTIQLCHFCHPNVICVIHLLHVNDENDMGLDRLEQLLMMHCYFSNGHPMWGLATIGLVFLPFALSLVLDHLFTLKIEDIKNLSTINLPCQQQEVPPVENHNTLSLKDVPTWLMQTIGRLPQCLRHLPIIQTINHIMVFLQLNKASLKYEHTKKKQKLTTNYIEALKKTAGYNTLEQEVNSCKQVVSTIQCKFQETKLLEAFGESAPQFALQVAIMIKLGHISPFQFFTVSTSIFSCTLAASNVFLKMPSKLNDIPHQNWRNLVLVLPAMLSNSLPRLLSISLIVAYMGPWSLIALALAFGLNCLVELFLFGVYHQSKNVKSIKGIFIAMLVPCIVMDQYSKFFFKTSIINAFIYVILVGLLFALVNFGFVAPAIDSLPPLTHCFHPVEWIPMANQTRCLYNGTILQDCLDSMITMSEELKSGYVPICQPGEEVWHQLDPVCLFLVGLFIISVGSSYFLHWYLDPINRLRATSWWCLQDVWDPSHDYLKKAVKTLVFQKKYLQYEELNDAFEKEHDQSLLYSASVEDLNQFVEVLVINCNADANRKNQRKGTSKPVSALEAASTHGRLRTLKILIAQVKNKGKWMCRCGWVKTFGPD
jgi:hypothetical protein